MLSPSWFSAAAGVWLVVSVFSWHHLADARANNVIVGSLIAVVAVGALRSPRVRYLNIVLAAWLFASALVLTHAYRFTIWHDIMVSLIVLGASLARASSRQLRRHRAL